MRGGIYTKRPNMHQIMWECVGKYVENMRIFQNRAILGHVQITQSASHFKPFWGHFQSTAGYTQLFQDHFRHFEPFGAILDQQFSAIFGHFEQR